MPAVIISYQPRAAISQAGSIQASDPRSEAGSGLLL